MQNRRFIASFCQDQAFVAGVKDDRLSEVVITFSQRDYVSAALLTGSITGLFNAGERAVAALVI
jgi:hypothetical protein